MSMHPWNLDFSYDYYREIIALLKRDFNLCSFHESPKYIGKRLDRSIAILRHDIDLDIDKALIMAEIESNMGVCSCFMFLTNCAFYSIEDDTVSSAIRSIKEMGHDIGIHYDIHQDKNSTIEIECSRLEDILNSVVKSISFHRPISEYLNGPIYIGDRVNTYASDLMNNYLSDSKGIWREGEPLTMIKNYRNKTDVILQLLVHPIWWGCEGVTASEKLQEYFENRTIGMSQKDKSYFDNELSKHLTVIRSGKLN